MAETLTNTAARKGMFGMCMLLMPHADCAVLLIGQLLPSCKNTLTVCHGSGASYAGKHAGAQASNLGGFCKARQRIPPYPVVGCIHHERPLDQRCASLTLLGYWSSPCCRAAILHTDGHRRIYGLVAGVALHCTRAVGISLLAGCRPLAVESYRR